TRTGVICEPNGAINNSGSTGDDSARAWLDANLKAHASILNLMGLWDLKRLTVDEIRECELAAVRAGPRFVVEEAVLPQALARAAAGRAWLAGSLTLAQRGSAPFHGTALVRVELAGGSGEPFRSLALPEPPLAQLLPGQTQVLPIFMELPSALNAPLRVRVALADHDRGPLQLGNDPADADGWLPLGTVSSDEGRSLSPLFDLATGRLGAAAGVSTTRSGEALRLSGTATGWSYAFAASDTKVDPKRLYVMRVRVRARPGKLPGSALSFKFGINDAKGAWTGNINTPKYDFAAPDTWQELTAIYRPRPGDGTLMLAAEKGRTAPSDVDAEIAAWTVHAVPAP
ncbi:MAG: hypothetical protein AAB368_01735, partial [bacterium]